VQLIAWKDSSLECPVVCRVTHVDSVLQEAVSAEALRLVLGVVELMTVLVDWINITLVMTDGGLLLQLLIEMLSLTGDVTVQLAAVDCLLAVTGRKVTYILAITLLLCLYFTEVTSSIQHSYHIFAEFASLFMMLPVCCLNAVIIITDHQYTWHCLGHKVSKCRFAERDYVTPLMR